MREAAVVVGLTLAAAAGAGEITGRVELEENGRRIPAAKVLVVAASMESGEMLAAARTGRDGTYRLAGALEDVIGLRAERAGWIGLAAGGAPGDSLRLDCRQACGPVDFILIRGGVLTGVVVDDLGEPLPRSQVRLISPREFQSGAVQAQDGTDDRGMFRIAGIAPGSYVVRVETPYRSATDVRWEAPDVEVEIEPGQETVLRLTLDRVEPRAFRVAGTVSGVDLPKGRTTAALIAGGLSSRRMRGGQNTTRVHPDGSFEFEALPAGEYFFHYTVRGRSRMGRNVSVGSLRVEADLDGVRLSPGATVSVSGRLELEGDWRAGPPPIWLRLQATPRISKMLDAQRGDWTFEESNVPPGLYGIDLRGREGFIREVRVGDVVVDRRNVEVGAGGLDGVVIVISNEYAELAGRIKNAAGEPAPHCRVGLAGAGRVRVVQADQFGRFRFSRLPPDGYRIAAWTDKTAGDLQLSETWEGAGDAVRSFPVQAGDRIELDLTAVPE